MRLNRWLARVSLMFVVGATISACATYEPPKTGPRITKFILEPAEFFTGDAITATLHYCDAKGGLGGNVEMEYLANAPGQTRAHSAFASSFVGKESCGTYKTMFSPTPGIPIDIAYFVRFKSEGTYSNWATASVRFLGDRPRK